MGGQYQSLQTISNITTQKDEAREMAQWLKALTAIQKVPGSTPSTQAAAHTRL